MKMQCFGPKNGYRFSAHAAAISNRFRGFSYPNLSFAATYRSSRFQRWDSTDFRFEISDRKTANSNANASANANTNANADPSPLKGLRDDSVAAFFRGL